jgi:hypothetical protein
MWGSFIPIGLLGGWISHLRLSHFMGKSLQKFKWVACWLHNSAMLGPAIVAYGMRPNQGCICTAGSCRVLQGGMWHGPQPASTSSSSCWRLACDLHVLLWCLAFSAAMTTASVLT